MIKFGWKRDLPDFRDFKYSAHPEFTALPPLPPSVDLRAGMSRVENQGNLGSCVAQAVSGILEFLQLTRFLGVFRDKFEDVSPLFIYWNARTLDGDNQSDSGTYIRTAIKALRTFGVCREVTWPYLEHRVYATPNSDAFTEAAPHKLVGGFRVNNRNLIEMKQCLAHGYPFAFGVGIYSSFMSRDTAETGVVTMPKETERSLGGHAMCCVGYDDEKQAFLVRNSWGDKWGIYGYCWMPYDYLNSTQLCSDCWTIRDE